LQPCQLVATGCNKVATESSIGFPLESTKNLLTLSSEILVCILSDGYLESQWCRTELETAITLKKQVIVVYDYKYHLPEPSEDPLVQFIKTCPSYTWIAGKIVIIIAHLCRVQYRMCRSSKDSHWTS
jgi:hypothetical protein